MRKVMGLLLVCLIVCSSLALADEDRVPLNPSQVTRPVQPQVPVERSGNCWLTLLNANYAYYWAWDLYDSYAEWLDPATDQDAGGGCTPPYYPFQINGVYFDLYAYTSDPALQVGFTYIVDVSIACAANYRPNFPPQCSAPPDDVVVYNQRISHDVTSEEWDNGLIPNYIPFGQPVCVNGPFYVILTLVYWEGPEGYAPGPLSAQTAIPNMSCRLWNRWWGGSPATFCWFNVQDDYVTPWGPYGIWVNGTAEAPCTPFVCNPCVNRPGDTDAYPFVVEHTFWQMDIDLPTYCSDYSQLHDVGVGQVTGAGPDVVLKLEFPPELMQYCFRIKIEPLCAVPSFFRIRSWIADSYGPFYLGNPNYPGVMANQYYNFTETVWNDGANVINPLGCYTWTPDVLYLYIDTRNNHCCCPIRVTYEGDAPLPVNLASFDVVAGDARVNVSWRTASESEIERYDVYRDDVRVFTVNASNNPSGASYGFTDTGLENGHTYRYSLRSVDLEGNVVTLAVADATPTEAPLATEYALYQNYPNPFNPSTSIRYTVKDAGLVTLKVYSVDGREVATLVNEVQAANTYSVNFDGTDLASGVYLYTLKVNGFSATHKMVLMK